MKKIYANNLTTLSLGRQGENLARQVVFDLSAWEAEYGPGVAELIHQRSGDAQPYPLAVQRDGTLVTWDVTETDAEMDGYGKCELRYYAGETLAKSQIWRTWVESAMGTPSETTPPEPEQGWVDQVLAVGVSVKEATDSVKTYANSAEQSASGAAQSAQEAAGSASAASTSETNAKASEVSAQASETAAQASKTAATESASAAANSAELASEDASAAAESASAAQQSARSAAESAAVYDNVVSDVNQLKEDVEHLAPTIVCKSSGYAVALDDSSNRPFCGLNLYGKTTQNGTPTPDAPAELESVGDGGSVVTAVCGKNLFADGKVYRGGLNNSYGEIYTKSPVESPVHSIAWAGVGIRVAVSPNNTYTVSSDITPCKYFTVTFYKEFDSAGSKKNAISFKEFTNRNTATFTTPENCYCAVITSVSNVESDFTWSWWQVEHGSAATVYEPYEGQTLSISTPNGLPGIPVSSGGNYTDSTGQQWICDEVDFERGVYVQRVLRKLFDGSETWIDGGTINGNVRPTNTLSEIIIKAPNPETKISSFCDFYQLRSSIETWEEKIGYSVSDKSNSIQFYNSNFTTLSSWKAYLAENPVTCLLQLASPIETAISAEELAAYAALRTNYPNTTIINDSGAWMEIGYQADTKMYIDKQFTELRNAIVALGGNV